MKKLLMLLSLICITCMAWGQSAEELMQKAQNGDAEAQYELGVAYEDGNLGLTKNRSEAAKWYLKAAEQGHAEAQRDIGGCYNYGNGVSKDKKKAEYWYRKSAAQGYEVA